MGFLGERGESEGGTTYRVNNMKPNVYGFFFLLGIATTNFLFFKI
jgi:hypothetical protein